MKSWDNPSKGVDRLVSSGMDMVAEWGDIERVDMTFPINFIHRAGMLDDVTFTGNMLCFIYR
ncbi:MAG: hypothetical protein AMS26_05165 [Bacteroides sp. SM23_62]|nr:MAG: hypothetical protein AMS26_05165 [Bacteroides sp. SM23_62]